VRARVPQTTPRSGAPWSILIPAFRIKRHSVCGGMAATFVAIIADDAGATIRATLLNWNGASSMRRQDQVALLSSRQQNSLQRHFCLR